MKLDDNRGFSMIEVIAALSIVMIVISCVIWNFPHIKKLGNTHLVIHRAAMLSTAKEAFLREQWPAALKNFKDSPTDEAKFDLIKRYLPYTNEATRLKQYTPKGFRYELGPLGSKVAIFDGSTSEPILY